MSLSAKSIAAAVAGAIAAASLATPATADDTGAAKEKCFGVSKAGENSCAGATHSCAGQSKVSSSGQDWTMVKAGTCVSMGGKTQAFENPKLTPPADKKG
jgi:uncharacterized membrane protein